MAKLTKAQAKAHREAVALLQKDRLTVEEKDFIHENWNEAARHDVSEAGAFFTPLSLASDFRLDVLQSGRIVDICAGIGALGHVILNWNYWGANETPPELVCIEINPEYVEIGRKLLPEATWICGDALDPKTWEGLGEFDTAISNPPFSTPRTYRHRSKAAGGKMEYAVIEQAAKVAKYGAFIIPQTSAPFVFSGARCHRWTENAKYEAFKKRTGIEIEFGTGVDTTVFRDQWKNTAPTVEIVTCEFEQDEAPATPAPAPASATTVPAGDLFAFAGSQGVLL